MTLLKGARSVTVCLVGCMFYLRKTVLLPRFRLRLSVTSRYFVYQLAFYMKLGILCILLDL